MKTKILFVIGLVLFVMVASNPDLGSFNTYLHSKTPVKTYRETNYFLCSVFAKTTPAGAGFLHERYLGILGHYITLQPKTSTQEID